MDYKKIVKSRSLRLKILELLSFIPDKQMIQLQYRGKMGRSLNLKNPKRFTEKLQWYKLYYHNPVMTQCVDKYEVRDFIKAKGFEHILVHSFGVYSFVKDIPWDNLPEKFVMKDTLGSGGNSVIIVRDKATMNSKELEAVAEKWLAVDVHTPHGGREWPYTAGKDNRIVIEEFLDADTYKYGLIDYKFFCFDGRVEMIYVMGDRQVGKSVKIGLYDRNFHKLPVQRVGDEDMPNAVKPENFEEMLSVAETLSSDFPHVRVDLYNLKGKIYFGEMTFFNASGYMKFDPDKYDFELGKKFKLRCYQDNK